MKALISPGDIKTRENLISAILISLKPTLYAAFFKRITKDMMKRYISEVRTQEAEREIAEQKRLELIQKLKYDFNETENNKRPLSMYEKITGYRKKDKNKEA